MQRAADKDVRGFGERMVRDHAGFAIELSELARQQNLDLPVTMEQSQSQQVQQLAALRGEDFDRKYMDEMVKTHSQVVQDLTQRRAGRAIPTSRRS